MVARVKSLEAGDPWEVLREGPQGHERRAICVHEVPSLGLAAAFGSWPGLAASGPPWRLQQRPAERGHRFLEGCSVAIRPEAPRLETLKVLHGPDGQGVAVDAVRREHLPQDRRVLVRLEDRVKEAAEAGKLVAILVPLDVGLLGPHVHHPREPGVGRVADLKNVHHIVVHEPHHGEEVGGKHLRVQPEDPRARQVRRDQELPHQGLLGAAPPDVREALGVNYAERAAHDGRVADLVHVRPARHRTEGAVRLLEQARVSPGKQPGEDALPAPRRAYHRKRGHARGLQVEATVGVELDRVAFHARRLEQGRRREGPGLGQRAPGRPVCCAQ
mmetsp:Transcript_86167/g.278871  ORF Transcript_86167/g.278871 Transcript_86167/m.278871 type:complete len:330 (+) Transcript_86167:788-1777(+)